MLYWQEIMEQDFILLTQIEKNLEKSFVDAPLTILRKHELIKYDYPLGSYKRDRYQYDSAIEIMETAVSKIGGKILILYF